MTTRPPDAFVPRGHPYNGPERVARPSGNQATQDLQLCDQNQGDQRAGCTACGEPGHEQKDCGFSDERLILCTTLPSLIYNLKQICKLDSQKEASDLQATVTQFTAIFQRRYCTLLNPIYSYTITVLLL